MSGIERREWWGGVDDLGSYGAGGAAGGPAPRRVWPCAATSIEWLRLGAAPLRLLQRIEQREVRA